METYAVSYNYNRYPTEIDLLSLKANIEVYCRF